MMALSSRMRAARRSQAWSTAAGVDGEQSSDAVPDLGHEHRGGQALADDVADEEARGAVAEVDQVAPVAADVQSVGARQVEGCCGQPWPDFRR